MDFSTKAGIQSALEDSLVAIQNWLKEQPEDSFNQVFTEGKWTMAGHVYHLAKSAKALAQGLKMPKLVLKMKFGTINRAEYEYGALREKYQTEVAAPKFKTLSIYAAEPGRVFDKRELMDRLAFEMNALQEVFNKWSEKDLSKTVLPHPAIGKLSLREFAMFTVLHNFHHLDNLKENYVNR